MSTLNIMILDDEAGIREELKEFFTLLGHDVFTAENPDAGFVLLKKNPIDILILDIQLPGRSGIEVLKEVKSKYPEIEVIMITGHGDQNCIIESLRYGAFDFFRKPFRTIEIQGAIERTKKFLTLQDELNDIKETYSLISRELQDQVGSTLIGDSPQIKKVMDLINKVAQIDDTDVLIIGESGTGKELIARLIHILSSRKDTYFFPVNCSAIPETLFESEFFGHVKGSFTGANENKKGWFEIADQGTLFLDEIGDMPLSQQIKLLRVLEDRKVRRLGSHREIDVNVRVISATNQNLDSMIEEKHFRNDLYHRLSSFVIKIPPLRERPGDIPLLIEHFTAIYSQKMRKSITKIDADVFNQLQLYSFAGNVRELKNMVERAIILTDDSTLRISAFPLINSKTLDEKESVAKQEILDLETLEKSAILKALTVTKNNKTKAADMLGISWYALNRKMKKHEIE